MEDRVDRKRRMMDRDLLQYGKYFNCNICNINLKKTKDINVAQLKHQHFILWIHDLVSQEVRFHNFKDLYTCMLKS